MSVVKLILFVGVFAMMCAEGMLVRPRDLGTVWRQPTKLLRGVLAVNVLVPIVAVLTVLVLRPSRPVTYGLAFLAAAPLAPLVLRRLAKSGGDFRLAASLHVALAALSIVSAPLTILVLGNLLGFHGVVPLRSVATSVVISLMLPFGVGMALKAWVPRRVEGIQRVLDRLGVAIILVFAVVLLVREGSLLLELGFRDYLAMMLFSTLALASGHVVAATDEDRTTFALESAARNPGLALMIATSSVGPVRGTPVLIPYLLVFVIMSSLYMALRKRSQRQHAVERTSAA